MGDFRFPVRRRPAAVFEAPQVEVVDPSEEEEIGEIQGRRAASIQEWRVAKALWALGHEFIYQYEVFGGSRVRGGQIVDFLVLTTAPMATPVQVNGEYWHEGSMGSEERLKQILLGHALRNETNETVILWAADLGTQADAHAAVAGAIGHG